MLLGKSAQLQIDFVFLEKIGTPVPTTALTTSAQPSASPTIICLVFEMACSNGYERVFYQRSSERYEDSDGGDVFEAREISLINMDTGVAGESAKRWVRYVQGNVLLLVSQDFNENVSGLGSSFDVRLSSNPNVLLTTLTCTIDCSNT